MEKLIALLNKYEQRKGEEYGRGNYVWLIDKGNKNIFASRFPDGAYICEEESRAIIICKGYNFIKRLVDNDKIDFDKVYEKEENENIDICMSGKDVDMYWLLMLLSIQDNPIEFLISVLK